MPNIIQFMGREIEQMPWPRTIEAVVPVRKTVPPKSGAAAPPGVLARAAATTKRPATTAPPKQQQPGRVPINIGDGNGSAIGSRPSTEPQAVRPQVPPDVSGLSYSEALRVLLHPDGDDEVYNTPVPQLNRRVLPNIHKALEQVLAGCRPAPKPGPGACTPSPEAQRLAVSVSEKMKPGGPRPAIAPPRAITVAPPSSRVPVVGGR